MSWQLKDLESYFCCMDITEILINKGKIIEKIKGYSNKIVRISAISNLRVLKMVPIEYYEIAQVPCSPITLSYVLEFSLCYINFRKKIIFNRKLKALLQQNLLYLVCQ